MPTVSIRRLTIRIVAQRDISRYDLDICNQGKSPLCLYFLYLTSVAYSFKKYNLCGRCLCKMPVEMDLKFIKWTILYLQWLKMVKSYSIEKCFSVQTSTV